VDLLLINPSDRKKIYGSLDFSLHGIEPPLWSGLLAGFLRHNNYSVTIIDAEAENLSPEEVADRILKEKPILAAIIVSGSNPSASTTNMTAAGGILKALKKCFSNITTLLGGLHPSALPERTLREEEVDFVCRGEGFYTIRDLLKILKEGRDPKAIPVPGLWYRKGRAVISNPDAPLTQDLDGLPFVAWDLLPMEKYRAHNWHCFEAIEERHPYAVIYTNLGCPFHCKFCCIHALYGRPGIRFRSPERVVEEIGYLVKNYKVKNIKFMDELFVFKEDRVRNICDLIIRAGYKLNIWCYARVDTVNESLLKKMKEAGINWLAYGIESANPGVRQGVDKTVVQEKIRKAVEMTQAAGIYIIGNFIFGLPDDNLETMKESLDMAKELNLEYINFYTAMAYPGSDLYKEAVARGVKLPEVWRGYSQYAEETLPLPTKYLSAAEVLRFRDRAFIEYFSRPEYLAMMEKKFGPKAVGHIKEMLGHQIHRRYA
jgi:radical SAM superfamily enzyme YgiQ (UPF0313 family)